MYINIKQRRPLFRVYNASGNSFYVDEDMEKVPSSGKFVVSTIPLTGQIFETLKDSGYIVRTSQIRNAAVFYRLIEKDALLNQLFTQLHVNSRNEYSAVSRLFGHRIMLGTAENFERALNKVKLFYNNGTEKGEMESYQMVDMRFENQIICSK